MMDYNVPLGKLNRGLAVLDGESCRPLRNTISQRRAGAASDAQRLALPRQACARCNPRAQAKRCSSWP